MELKIRTKRFLIFLLACLVLLPPISAEGAQKFDTVRVALAKQTESMSFKTNGDYQLINLSNGKVITEIGSKESWLVELQAGQIMLQSSGKKYGPFSGPVAVQENNIRVSIIAADGNVAERTPVADLVALNASGEAVDISENTGLYVRNARNESELASNKGLNLISLLEGTEYRRYRGNMEFRVESGSLVAINELNIEDYLRGVVPAEMPSSWPAEALKAQAVVARNYALQRVEATSGASYNLTNDQSSQVYLGYDKEVPATDQAVEDTRGVVMLNRGKLISSFFHSSSGGYTENSEDVWSSALPYIKYKKDPFDKNNLHYNWQVDYTAAQLLEMFKKSGYEFKKITGIDTVYTASGARVKKLTVSGVGTDDKPLRIEIANADNVRIALGLKSALFTLKKGYDKDKNLTGVNITGSGWGHGLGLSQWGANGMARQGYNYQEILKYYYSNIKIAENYGR
ncbi:SpoIID/LytB domain-containing protein [Pelotomaculum terephthalicicum JT]|uniref:SpoIID/LytB domain-containing protein n=1 Tax=Pelotomaculum TaxID=191373 RepID=UPI0009CCA59D|nr:MULTISPECIES: SpoIID/LytB domain-containing protein [Pelotomaculum]MCG9969827.1 SpoIID/LytB domain-containing protein [Pelotomaculum terephthalicicum JT]OPX85313.1 MAG: Amidase enhancer precursor [Pelotomaculum sp. PtaB.Bin117]OPY62384.1 MAG: Amidase enhancer precursor [Pelotomaculum sp. PtaU1.Bin065]